MHSAKVLLVLLLMMWCVLLVAWWLDRPNAGPAAHPQYAHMEVGGTRAASDLVLLPWAALFAALMVLCFHACLRLGCGSNWQQSWLLRWLVRISTFAVLVLLLGVFWIYGQDASRESHRMWGPLPAATAWMALSIWGAPVLYGVIYFCGFDRWFRPTPEQDAGR